MNVTLTALKSNFLSLGCFFSCPWIVSSTYDVHVFVLFFV